MVMGQLEVCDLCQGPQTPYLDWQKAEDSEKSRKGEKGTEWEGEQEGNNLHGKLKQIEIGKIVVHGKICNRRP